MLVLKSTKTVLELNLNSKYNKISLAYFALEMFQKGSRIISIFVELTSSKK